MTRLLGAAAVLVALVPTAWGQEIGDGTDLAGYCNHHPADVAGDTSAALSLVLCYGFLKGVGDTYAMVAAAGDGPSPLCPPDARLSNEEARLVFADWARSNPDKLEVPAVAAVTAALSEAYPCGE